MTTSCVGVRGVGYRSTIADCDPLAMVQEIEKKTLLMLRILQDAVCSIVINGVLLKNGIPSDSKFGGILQVKNGDPLRFVELIYYSGSSLK